MDLTGQWKKSMKGTFLNQWENKKEHNADVSLLGCAIDLTSTYGKGAWYGPQAVLNASHQIEYEAPQKKISFDEKIQIHNQGILEYPQSVSEQDLENTMSGMVSDVKGIAEKVLDQNRLFVLLGGDHSAPNGVFQAIAEKINPKEVSILHFDAHLDLRDDYHGPFGHACIAKRARDLGFTVVQVGVRDHVSFDELEYIEKEQTQDSIYWCHTQPHGYYKSPNPLFRNTIKNGTLSEEQISSITKKLQNNYLWITIDVDGFDPLYFPGTGTPLPHGMTLHSGEELFFSVLREFSGRVLGFDVCEVSPQFREDPKGMYDVSKTVSTQTEMNAALLVYKLLMWKFLDRFR